jgi:hypothetical protein
MTAAPEPATEREAKDIDFDDLCQEFEALERRVILQSLHIQKSRFETDGGAYQPEERLEEAENISVEEETEKQLGDRTVELESTAEWKLNATMGDKDNTGDQVDLPTYKEEEM